MRGNTIIAVTNSKGGVGKMTTAFDLGATLEEERKHVLLVDNNPQMSFSRSNQTAYYNLTHDFQKSADIIA